MTAWIIAHGVELFYGAVALWALVFVGIMFGPIASRYPDGRCYICRKGAACPGDDCPICGAYQP